MGQCRRERRTAQTISSSDVGLGAVGTGKPACVCADELSLQTPAMVDFDRADGSAVLRIVVRTHAFAVRLDLHKISLLSRQL